MANYESEEENEEDGFEGFGTEDFKKRSKYWAFFSEVIVNGITFAKCNLCIDKDT